MSNSLLAQAQAEGFTHTDVPILQPANIFLDLSGEELRSRLVTTTTSEGQELCLRPEFTIPLTRALIAAGKTRGDYVCAGPVFRQRAGQTGEVPQIGLESFGDNNSTTADARILSLVVRMLAAHDLIINMGEASLIPYVVEQLGLPAAWVRRWKRHLTSGSDLKAAFARLEQEKGEERYEGLLRALSGASRDEARTFVEDILRMAGIRAVGRRSAPEIAERFLEKASAENNTTLSVEARTILERLLSLSSPLSEAPAMLASFAKDSKLNLDPIITALKARIEAFAAAGLNPARMDFMPAFDRPLDYYTGMMFEIYTTSGSLPLAAGGRYDRLATLLSSPQPVPAVGAVVWTERLLKGDKQ